VLWVVILWFFARQPLDLLAGGGYVFFGE